MGMGLPCKREQGKVALLPTPATPATSPLLALETLATSVPTLPVMQVRVEDGGALRVPIGHGDIAGELGGEMEFNKHGRISPLRSALVGRCVEDGLPLVVLRHVDPIELVHGSEGAGTGKEDAVGHLVELCKGGELVAERLFQVGVAVDVAEGLVPWHGEGRGRAD